MYIKEEIYENKETPILYSEEGYVLLHKPTKLIYGSVTLKDGRKEEDYEEIKEEIETKE